MQSRHPVLITWVVCATLLVALLGLALPFSSVLPAAAQGENLLQNGGFEGEYVAVGGDTTLQVAPNWQPWSLPPPEGASSSVNLRPDYQPAPTQRVRSGNAAQEYNTFFATHDAGVYQRVPVEAGAELRFSAHLYVWSSATFENQDASVEPQDVNLQVGIDPTGGQDGASEAIVWSEPVQFYDEYRELSVSATAEANAVTVFVRSNPQGAVGVNNIYVDDASLIQVGEGEAPAEATPASDDAPAADATDEVTTDATADADAEATEEASSASEAPQELSGQITYTVQAGDTVLAIANAYGSTVEAIIEANGLNENGFLSIGQELVIPVVDDAEEALAEAMMNATAAATADAEEAAGTAEPMAADTGGSAVGEGDPGPAMGSGPAAGAKVHVVQPGETLYRIALRYNTTVEALATLNRLTNANLIYVGMQLHVPGAGQPQQPSPAPEHSGGRSHVVQQGDNAYRISLRYGITIEALAAANNLSNPNLLYLGQVLIIP